MKGAAVAGTVLALMACGGNASQPSPVACSEPMLEVSNPYDYAVDVGYTPRRFSDRRFAVDVHYTPSQSSDRDLLGTVDPHTVVRFGPIGRAPPITFIDGDGTNRFTQGSGSPSFTFTYRIPGQTDLFTASDVRSGLVCP